jgi:hypothetical protein
MAGNLFFLDFFLDRRNSSSSGRVTLHQSKDGRGGGEKGWGSILFVCLDMSHLAAIGTLPGCARNDLIAGNDRAARGSSITGGIRPLVEFFLLFSGLASCLVLFQSCKFLLNSKRR